MKIKAIRPVAIGKVEIVETVIAKPKGWEILVKTKACGICKGDVYILSGKFGKFPSFFGHEGVGIVEEVGEFVEGFEPGDKVTTLGHPSMAEYHKLDRTRVAKIPADVEEYQYWISEPVACAVNNIRNTRVEPGDTVVLIGCGYMGLLNLQGLPINMTERTIAVDIAESPLKLAKRFGADLTLNASQVDIVKEVLDLTKGRGADIVIEATGVPGTLETATKITRPGGRLCIFGFHVGEEKIPTGVWHMKSLEVLNTAPSISRNFIKDMQDATKLMIKGTFDQKPLITHSFPYTEAQKAFEVAMQHPEGYIKGAILF